MKTGAPIQVEALNHTFGKGSLARQVLNDIHTEIPQGEIVIVTGPSGSGKTTLLTLVGALRSAQTGSLVVLGEQLTNAKPRVLERVRKQIGFIFQSHNLLGALSALQNVELGLRVSAKLSRSKIRMRSKAMLESVGLSDFIHHKPGKLSGGQRQRVAIARALVSEPGMLLADEPTASLDRKSGREVVELMQKLAKEHDTTILLVTHDNRILDIADRIVHLEDGNLSTFTESVIANNELMMKMLADNRQKHHLDDQVDDLNEQEFRHLLEEMTRESRQFIRATELANDVAFKSMLEQGLFAFTRKLGLLLNADRASLFLVDGKELVLKVAENIQDLGEIRIPVGSGIAGAVAGSGESIRIDDAYQDDRFNQAVDQKTGYTTRSILCLPVKDQSGTVFAVAQLLNRKDGQPFNADDEARFAEFLASIGLIFETLEALTSKNMLLNDGEQ